MFFILISISFFLLNVIYFGGGERKELKTPHQSGLN